MRDKVPFHIDCLIWAKCTLYYNVQTKYDKIGGKTDYQLLVVVRSMKTVGLLAILLLLLCFHDGSIPLPGVGGSAVSCEWTFQGHWFQASFVVNILLVILAVLVTLSCITFYICFLTFVGLSTAVSRIQPMASPPPNPGICSVSYIHTYIHTKPLLSSILS